MNPIKKSIYHTFQNGIRAYLKLFLEFKVWGKENLIEPPVIYCSNHISSSDPFFVLTMMPEPVHMIIGPGFSVPIGRWFMKQGEMINALPEHRRTVIEKSVGFLNKGESVYIFPEGDLNDQKDLRHFFTGIGKIYLQKPVPIIPIGIVAPRRFVKEKSSTIQVEETTYKTLLVNTGKYYANIGRPLLFETEEKMSDPKEAAKMITKKIKTHVEFLIDDIKSNKFWE